MGHHTSTIAMTALRTPGPSDAVMAIASRIGGNAMVMSMNRMSAASTHPPRNPASAPTTVPRTTADTMTMPETGNEMRDPHSARMNTSVTPLVSPSTRSLAVDVNTTKRPSDEIAG